jgi:1-phosphatidylinositol-4-phosphate 5-kinase
LNVCSNTSVWTQEYGGFRARSKAGAPLGEIYYFGLIDILTQYDLKKKSEHAIKSLLYVSAENSEISVQPPDVYKERFLKYMESIIIGD